MKAEANLIFFEKYPLYWFEEKPVDYFGSDPKNMTLVLSQQNSYFFTSPYYFFLSQILKSVGLSYKKIGLVLESPSLSLDFLCQTLKPQKILFFGQSAIFPKNELYITTHYQNIPCLNSNSLSELYASKEKKKRLWQSLKTFV